MEHSACFIGHREIEDTPELRERLRRTVLQLIENGTVNFIFGDHSAFNTLCYETVTALKKEHPAIRRIHFRISYEDADAYTTQYLLLGFEKSICPEGVGRAGRASYTERNRAMIRESEVCVFYYDEGGKPSRGTSPKSGTAVAYAYAVRLEKRIENLCTR